MYLPRSLPLCAPALTTWVGESGRRYDFAVLRPTGAWLDEPAVFIMTKREGSRDKPLFIGQTGSLERSFGARALCPELWAHTMAMGMTHLHLRFEACSERSRRAEVRDLVAAYRPALNEQPGLHAVLDATTATVVRARPKTGRPKTARPESVIPAARSGRTPPPRWAGAEPAGMESVERSISTRTAGRSAEPTRSLSRLLGTDVGRSSHHRRSELRIQGRSTPPDPGPERGWLRADPARGEDPDPVRDANLADGRAQRAEILEPSRALNAGSGRRERTDELAFPDEEARASPTGPVPAAATGEVDRMPPPTDASPEGAARDGEQRTTAPVPGRDVRIDRLASTEAMASSEPAPRPLLIAEPATAPIPVATSATTVETIPTTTEDFPAVADAPPSPPETASPGPGLFRRLWRLVETAGAGRLWHGGRQAQEPAVLRREPPSAESSDPADPEAAPAEPSIEAALDPLTSLADAGADADTPEISEEVPAAAGATADSAHPALPQHRGERAADVVATAEAAMEPGLESAFAAGTPSPEPQTSPSGSETAAPLADAPAAGPDTASATGRAGGTPPAEPSLLQGAQAGSATLSSPPAHVAVQASPAAASTAEPARSRAAGRRALDLDSTAPCVLFAGELSWAAGLDILLDALEVVCAEDERLQAVFAGSGPMSGDLERRVRASAFAARCRILGHVPPSRFGRVLEACDFVAIPARVRQSPELAAFALSRGKPVLATHQAGLPMIVHGQNGLVTYDNPGSFVWGIRELAGPLCRDLRRHMAEAA